MTIERKVKERKKCNALNWISWLIGKEPKEIKTTEGNTYKMEGLMGLHIFPDGTLFFLTASDDNTITLIPTDIVDVPMPKEKDIDVSYVGEGACVPNVQPPSDESKTLLRKRVEDIVDYYLEGDGKDFGKEGLVGAITALAKNIMRWDNIPTYESENKTNK